MVILACGLGGYKVVINILNVFCKAFFCLKFTLCDMLIGVDWCEAACLERRAGDQWPVHPALPWTLLCVPGMIRPLVGVLLVRWFRFEIRGMSGVKLGSR